MRLVTLTTDFGAGTYVAQVKGVILSLCPDAAIVDATHEVAPGDVHEAAYAIETVVPAFPEGSVHVVVVDPGVGTARRVLAVRFAGRLLLAPDNGVLTPFLPAATEIREVTNRELFLPEVSATFHGRDVFAPVAAHLAAGADPAVVGPLLDGAPVVLDDFRAEGDEGRVLSVDRFGNLITSYMAEVLAERLDASVAAGDTTVSERAVTFGEAPPGTPFLFAGSGGRVEIAVAGDSAAAALGWTRGTALRLVETGR